MAWRWPGDKPLSEPMMVNLLTHICVTRPQWVNIQTHAHKPIGARQKCARRCDEISHMTPHRKIRQNPEGARTCTRTNQPHPNLAGAPAVQPTHLLNLKATRTLQEPTTTADTETPRNPATMWHRINPQQTTIGSGNELAPTRDKSQSKPW